jgi:hypothetical protein
MPGSTEVLWESLHEGGSHDRGVDEMIKKMAKEKCRKRRGGVVHEKLSHPGYYTVTCQLNASLS